MIDDTTFPSPRVPDRPAARRLLGIYEQRQEGLLMQRVKVPGGRLTADQWRALARAASARTPGYPLHVTTRQDVEFHGLAPERVPDVQKELAGAGLTTLGAAGDTLRNVTVCPGCGICPDTVDVSALAEAVRRAVESLPWSRELPRKFKISLSGCERACARPWINDLGIVARADGRFRIIGAGSLGARPGLGILLYNALGLDDLLPLVIATLRFFHAEGDRENRKRARLRHVRERLGDSEFCRRLDDRLREERAGGGWSSPTADPVESGRARLLARLHLPCGDIAPADAAALADTAERSGATVRIGFTHDLLVYGEQALDLPPTLEGLTERPTIVACPGCTSCPLGLADARAAADRIGRALPSGAGAVVAISGCPNNCAHAAVADIGMTGCTRKDNGSRTECFRLMAGGGRGRTPELGIEVHPAVPAAHIARAAAHLACLYADCGGSESGSFARFVREHRDEMRDQVETMVTLNGGRESQ